MLKNPAGLIGNSATNRSGRNRWKASKRNRTEELRLWSVDDSGDVEPLKPLQQMPTELELEELLVRHPEMLDTGLKLVGRQTPTQAGWLDLLGVDKDGWLVVYELKRGQLIQDAVTQVLVYASDLDAMSTSQLATHIVDRSTLGRSTDRPIRPCPCPAPRAIL